MPITLKQSTSIKKPGYQRLSVILRKVDGFQRYVTHLAMEDGGYLWGDYFNDIGEAEKNYFERCKEQGVKDADLKTHTYSGEVLVNETFKRVKGQVVAPDDWIAAQKVVKVIRKEYPNYDGDLSYLFISEKSLDT